jgi:ribonuclease HI
MITIYTDGSCLKNPGGAGGWAFCLLQDDKEYYMSGGENISTNNTMELTAVIEALSFVNIKEKCKIYTDSMLVINCALGKWKRKANLNLWKQYDDVSQGKNISFEHVKAHNGNYYNEKVDKLAREEAKKI